MPHKSMLFSSDELQTILACLVIANSICRQNNDEWITTFFSFLKPEEKRAMYFLVEIFGQEYWYHLTSRINDAIGDIEGISDGC